MRCYTSLVNAYLLPRIVAHGIRVGAPSDTSFFGLGAFRRLICVQLLLID